MISLRLKEITKFLDKNDLILDIGCDHAKLAIHLYNEGFKISISDVSKNALNSGLLNIKNNGLEGKIKYYLSDGLKNINDNFDTIIISGMGSRVMIDIIGDKEFKTIILQPNNNQYELRKFMNKKGYIIDKETLVLDNNYIYTTMRFIKGDKKYSNKELIYGPLLIEEKNELFIKKYTKELNANIKVYKKMNIYLKIKKIKILFKIFELKKIIK